MYEPPTALAAPLPRTLIETGAEAILWIVLALALSAFLSTLRSSLRFSLPTRTLGRAQNERQRARLEPLIENADGFAISAGIYKITCDLIFVLLLVGRIAGEAALELEHLALAVAIGAPTLLLVTEAVPVSIARAWGDRLLLVVLPTFRWAQLPVVPVVGALQSARRALLRALSIEDDSSSRVLIEGLRDVARTASAAELEATERELIENVMEFGDVDAAEVMTPRTEMAALPVETAPEEALATLAESGHSRMPVYEENVDSVIGTVSALELAKVLVGARRDAARPDLRDLMRPAMLVPETKLVSELLAEFRSRKQKMAIVVDEYGGTAGVVTLADVMAEIVGTIRDEYQEGEDGDGLRALGDGSFEVQAGLHVSEVNEALGLEIPEEEDFETLGGFVLAQLGHFPKAGESFRSDEVLFSVAEASDRRVLKVHVQRSA